MQTIMVQGESVSDVNLVIALAKTNVHLFVKWMGTHAEYTKLCNEGKQYDVNAY